MRQLDGITDSVDSGRRRRTGNLGVLQSMGSQRVNTTVRLNNSNIETSIWAFLLAQW